MIPLPFILRAKLFIPLAEIRRNIQLTEGDLAHRYPVRMPNELGQIANAFSIMQTQWLVSIDHIKVAIRDSMQSIRDISKQSGVIAGTSTTSMTGWQPSPPRPKNSARPWPK